MPIAGYTITARSPFTGQLALAHTYGHGGRDSCLNTVKAVSNLLYGIEIDHYVAVTMDAVAIINDMVGGVQVEMMEDFSSSDPSMTKGATVTLHGEQALTYVRTRAGLEDSTNVSRMTRQRQYLNALASSFQACAAQDDSFPISIATAISKYMESDCTAEQLSALLNDAQTYQSMGIESLEGESVRGEKYMEFYVDDDALRSYVISNFYEPYSGTEVS